MTSLAQRGLLLADVSTVESISAYKLPGLTIRIYRLEIVWAILTFAQSRGTKAWHFYLLRALIGFWEAPSFGATHFLLGSWYKNEELFKRAGTWFTCNALGSMISGKRISIARRPFEH
jgi:MFS family permease